MGDNNNQDFERIPLPARPPTWTAELEERRNSRRPRPPLGYVNVEAQRLRAMQLVNAHNSEFGIQPTAPLEFTHPSRPRPRQRIGDSFQMIVILQLLLQITRRLLGLVLVDPTDEDAMSRRAREVDIYRIEAPPLDADEDDVTNRADYNEIMAEQEERQRRFQEIREQREAAEALLAVEREIERERIREADRVIRARVEQELADRENALRAAEAAREEESRASRARYWEERNARERAEQVAREAARETARAEREAQRAAAAEEARIGSLRYWEGLRARERAEEAARAEREARLIAEDERRMRGNLEERTQEETSAAAAASRSGFGWNAFALQRSNNNY